MIGILTSWCMAKGLNFQPDMAPTIDIQLKHTKTKLFDGLRLAICSSCTGIACAQDKMSTAHKLQISLRLGGSRGEFPELGVMSFFGRVVPQIVNVHSQMPNVKAPRRFGGCS